MTIASLNALDREAFVSALGWIFEGSPWVAERSWPARPFASVDGLHRVMCRVVEAASVEEQLALLRAHPDLGARAAMSQASVSEQQRAGLHQLSPDDHGRLLRLNAAYRERFGIPFILAVRASTVGQILEALDRRLSATPGQEITEALAEVARIARFRLDAAIAPPPAARSELDESARTDPRRDNG